MENIRLSQCYPEHMVGADALKTESMEDLKGGGSPLSQEISPGPPPVQPDEGEDFEIPMGSIRMVRKRAKHQRGFEKPEPDRHFSVPKS